MTQGELAAAVGYSVSFISGLEQNRRLPAVAVVLQQIVDAMIIPSLYEPFGRVALEPMAFGCNMIASEIGGLGEVVKHLENGLTIRPNDPQSIVRAVNLLFADPAAAQQRRIQALNEIHTLYDWGRIAAQTAQLL